MRLLSAGILAGLIAGVVMGVGMQMMTAPTPTGDRVPMMEMIGEIYHLFNSAIIGAAFALVFGSLITRLRSGIGWGLVYGVIWWVLGGLTLMPLLLGMPVFAPLMMPEMRPMAMGSLMGHLLYGLILGVIYVWLARVMMRRGPEPALRGQEHRRPV